MKRKAGRPRKETTQKTEGGHPMPREIAEAYVQGFKDGIKFFIGEMRRE